MKLHVAPLRRTLHWVPTPIDGIFASFQQTVGGLKITIKMDRLTKTLSDLIFWGR
jgi:hypothetical protein